MRASFDRRAFREQRRAQGLTQRQVAQLLGVDKGTVQGWERGLYTPQPSNREKVDEFMAGRLAPVKATPPTTREAELTHVIDTAAEAAAMRVLAGFIAAKSANATAVDEKTASHLQSESDLALLGLGTEVMSMIDSEIQRTGRTTRPLGMEKAQLGVSIGKEEHEALRRFAESRNVSLAELIRAFARTVAKLPPSPSDKAA